ncbi:MAG TPA: excinuclease ABC subunit UvrA [Bacteroidales bacterium]|nr:excinuclease ABC subunit UvrA [Bacteroidales bacterium]
MNPPDVDKLSPKEYIIIKNARVHNLKHISLALPRNKLIVITGLSGSGKSSLAFDTLYAEGQRRYVESLSSYARQFLGRMPKPEVDYIKGISPAIAIEQKIKTHNPRSTVGTSTEIYDYLKLLFARIGQTYSPVSGNIVRKDSITDIVDHILGREQDDLVYVECPLLVHSRRTADEQLKFLHQQGFRRLDIQGEIMTIDAFKESGKKLSARTQANIVVDRIRINADTINNRDRITDSVQTAFYEGGGQCIVIAEHHENRDQHAFSDKFELDGMTFEEPSVNLFTFNNPYGACKVCEGFGSIIGIDEDLVIPNKTLSIYEDAVACWKGEKMSEWKDQLIKNAYKFDFPIHKPYMELSDEHKELLWKGNEYFGGISDFFKYVETQTYKIQYRVMLARYRGKTICPDCKGTRLRKDASFVKINGKSIIDIVLMPVKDVQHFFNNIELNDYERQVAKRILIEIHARLQFLTDVGLGYLTLNRASNSLSGGESQRINLATALGSSLVGSMYILDEPSIGLHPRDNARLIIVLKRLRNIGNTVIVVEHDEEIMKSSDQIVDIGPMAGIHGGEVVFQGTCSELLNFPSSLTSRYLNKSTSIPLPKFRRPWKQFVEVCGAHENNLKKISVKFPLNVLTVVTGVSGSGKTTLVKQTLYTALRKIYGGYSEKTGKHIKLNGNIDSIGNIEYVDQNPIGKSSRSNPVTYIKAYDEIRSLFAEQKLSKLRGFKPGYFSFNIPGGRCEECQGDGFVSIEMQFMADIELVCESCGGKRFKDEVLEITWNGKNISEVLDMTIDEALEFFDSQGKRNSAEAHIINKLKPLADVGLGYVKLGQPSSTLSGGEAQRLKLASYLSKGSFDKPTMFIFDEPTTGLHFHDIHKLYDAFTALIDNGHTIVVIEHNMELIKCADWLIDLGPEGGNEGGYVVFEGTPEDMLACKDSYTAKYLKDKLL